MLSPSTDLAVVTRELMIALSVDLYTSRSATTVPRYRPSSRRPCLRSAERLAAAAAEQIVAADLKRSTVLRVDGAHLASRVGPVAVDEVSAGTQPVEEHPQVPRRVKNYSHGSCRRRWAQTGMDP